MVEYKWHIFLANLDPVVGSEQGKTMPILVISEEEINQILPVVNVFPITSRKPGRKIYPNEVLLPAKTAGLENDLSKILDNSSITNQGSIGEVQTEEQEDDDKDDNEEIKQKIERLSRIRSDVKGNKMTAFRQRIASGFPSALCCQRTLS